MKNVTIVSADGHSVMPPELWSQYLEPEFHDYLSAFEAENDVNGRTMVPLNDMMMNPARDVFDRDGAYEQGGWEGAWDADVRLAQMDREGIAAEIVHHGFFRIADLGFSVMSEPRPDDVIDAGARAHDRWAHDTFGASDRLLLVGAMGAGTELQRTIDAVAWCADHGFVGTYAPGFVALPGRLPPLDDEYWDPLWAVYADRGLTVIVHGGYGLEQGFAYGAMDDALKHVANTGGDVMDLAMELGKSFNADFFSHLGHRQAFWQMLLGGVFDRHPKLKLMMTEVRADWIPALLRYLDRVFEEHRADLPTKRKPSEWWDTNGMAGVSFMHKVEVENRHDIGVDHMNFGRDYPHAEGTWPNTLPLLQDLFFGIPEADVRKLLGENLIRFLDLDAAKLDEVAARIGPSIEQLTGGEALDPALLAHLDQRTGYLKPYEGETRISEMEPLVLADVARVGASR